MRGITIWAAEEDSRRHYTVCGYLWPASSDNILDLRFFVQHVMCVDEYEAKAVGIAQAKSHAGLHADAVGVAFAVFAGHLDELSWTALIPPASGDSPPPAPR